MSDTQILQGIQRSLGKLEGQVKEGFRGVHHRQDVTNGSIKDHNKRLNKLEECLISPKEFRAMEEKLNKVEDKMIEKKGERRVIMALIGFGAGLAPMLLQYLAKIIKIK